MKFNSVSSRRRKSRTAFACCIVAVIALVGCQSAGDRYQWNLSHAKLSPQVRRLPRAEIDQILHLMAYSWHQPVICIHGSRRNPRQLSVITGFPNGERREQFGWCVLEKQNGTWRIVEKYPDLDPVLVWGPPCEP